MWNSWNNKQINHILSKKHKKSEIKNSKINRTSYNININSTYQSHPRSSLKCHILSSSSMSRPKIEVQEDQHGKELVPKVQLVAPSEGVLFFGFHWKIIYIYINHWLVVGEKPLWEMMEFVTWDDNRNPILMGKFKIHGNQTTNQFL